MKTIFIASGDFHADQVRAFLQAHGIPTAIRGESLRKTHGLTLDGLGRVEILVNDEDEANARILLADAEAGKLRL